MNKNHHIDCVMEEMYREDGYVVIHDGQQRPSDDGSRQFTSPPGEIRFFTRTLRKMVKGRFVDRWVVFKYDLREGFCVDVQVTKKEPDGKKRSQRLEQKDRENTLEAGGRGYMRCILEGCYNWLLRIDEALGLG